MATTDLAHAVADQMLHRELGHFAGADQQHLFVLQGAEDLAPQFNGRIADGDGMVADAGFGADPLGHEEGPVQEPVQDDPGAFLHGGAGRPSLI